jgi:dimethylhistidine N-methyltransferase
MTNPNPPSTATSHDRTNGNAASPLRSEIEAGLRAEPPRVSPKFLYDELGSRLFDAITLLPEYYPTRTEAEIFDTYVVAMAQAMGTVGTLVDLGAGNCSKASRLIQHLHPERYVGIDISAAHLDAALTELQQQHPALEVRGLSLDFSTSLDLPAGTLRGRPVFFYPGSSIGNFAPPEASAFLRRVSEHAHGGGLLIGVDLVKASRWLEPAYDDAIGVTAAFNLNLLRHLNRLIGSDFNPAEWKHVAFFNAHASRIEMHLEARRDLVVRWPGGERRFAAGDRLHTESSYKYTVEGFSSLLQESGFARSRCWVDSESWFAVFWADV